MEKERISEWFGYSIVILERRDEYILFKQHTSQHKHVVNYNTLSRFSLRGMSAINPPTVDQIFHQCRMLSEIEELLNYNFKTEYRIGIDKNIRISSSIKIEPSIFSKYLYIHGPSSHNMENFDLNTMNIHDILECEVLQQFRINHSKPVNKIIID